MSRTEFMHPLRAGVVVCVYLCVCEANTAAITCDFVCLVSDGSERMLCACFHINTRTNICMSFLTGYPRQKKKRAEQDS